MVNKGSASASEIVAGALQDTDAILLGEYLRKGFSPDNPSHDGRVRDKTDGGPVLHTAGRQIHKKGLVPDIVVPVPEYSKAEQKAVLRLMNEDHLARFLKEHPEYTAKHLADFVEALRKKDIVLPEEEVERWIYWEKNKVGEPELVNLRFDIQLRKAVELFGNATIKAPGKIRFLPK